MKLFRRIYDRLLSSPERKVVTANFLSLFSSQAIAFIVPLITTPYLIRVLGADKFGLIAFAQALIQYFIVLIDYGFSLSAIREISINRADTSRLSSIFSAVAIIRGFFLVVSLAILSLGFICAPKLVNDWPIYAMYMFYLFGYVLFPVHFFQGVEKMKYILLCSFVTLFSTLAIFVFVRSGKDILFVPLLAGLGAIVSGVLGWRIACKRFNVRFLMPTFQQINYQLAEGWQAFLINITTVTFSGARTFTVGLFASYTITGYYAVADRVASLFITFPLVLTCLAVYPRLSISFSQDKARAGAQAYKFQKIVTMSYFVLTATAFLCARHLIFLMSGGFSGEAILSLRLLLVGVFLTAANAFRLQFCYVSGRRDVFNRIILLGVAGTVLTFALSAFFSYIGTACSFILIAIASLLVTPEISRDGHGTSASSNA